MRLIGIVGNAGSGKSTLSNILAQVTRGELVALADPMKEFAQSVFKFSNPQLWGPSELRAVPDLRYTRDLRLSWFRRLLRGDANPRNHLYNWQQARGRVARHGPLWVEDLFDGDPNDRMDALWRWFDRLPNTVLTPRIVLQTLGTEFGRAQDSGVWIRECLKRAEDSDAPVVCIPDVRFTNEARTIRRFGGHLWRVYRAEDSRVPVACEIGETEQWGSEMDQYVTREIDNTGSVANLVDQIHRAVESLQLHDPRH